MQHIQVQRIIDANSNLSQADLVKYKAELETLLANIEGTIPGSRGFGMANQYIDAPPGDVANMMAMELADKCAIYIPAISVDQVQLVSTEGTEKTGAIQVELTISAGEEE